MTMKLKFIVIILTMAIAIIGISFAVYTAVDRLYHQTAPKGTFVFMDYGNENRDEVRDYGYLY